MTHSERDDEAATMAGFTWPPLMTTKRATLYTGQSRHAIGRAVRAGELVPAGKRGRSWVFRRADLDQWMLGHRDDDGSPVAEIVPLRPVRNTSSIEDSINRIRQTARRDP